MKKELCDLTPQEMADKMFQDVYNLMPDATDWMPDFMIVNLTKKIVVSVITNSIDFTIWNEKQFFYWEQVINHVNNF